MNLEALLQAVTEAAAVLFKKFKLYCQLMGVTSQAVTLTTSRVRIIKIRHTLLI
jgi:hypothetical protein